MLERQMVAEGVPLRDTCPKDLRLVLSAWKEGRVSGVELVEASYRAQLDLLDDYRHKTLPTPPSEISNYRSLDYSDKAAMSEAAKAKLCRENRHFYDQEERIRQTNYSNISALKELLAWCKEQGVAETICQKVNATLHTHQGMALDVKQRSFGDEEAHVEGFVEGAEEGYHADF